MIKYIKIFVINIGVLAFALILIELFFIIKLRFQFLAPLEPIYPIGKSINLAEIKANYGENLFSVPKHLKTKISPELLKLDNVIQDHERKWKETITTRLPNGISKQHVISHGKPPHEKTVLYDVEYKFDKFGRRQVENQQDRKKSERYLLALGDSNTFGEGVTTGLDYPSQLATKISNNIRLYNMGIPGAGPNDLLYSLQYNSEFLDYINEKTGIAFWVFVDPQIERFLCELFCYQTQYSEYIYNKPEYELVNGTLRYIGKFEENKGLRRLFLRIIGKSEALKYLGLHLKYSQNELDSLAIAFKEINKILIEKKGLSKFTVVFLDHFYQKNELISYLNNKGIETLDISDFPQFNIENPKIPFDYHPTSNFYWYLTEILKKHVE